MEECSSKGSDTAIGDKSPTKKARIDDQQPSSSTGLTSNAAANSTCPNSASTATDENKNGEVIRTPHDVASPATSVNVSSVLAATTSTNHQRDLRPNRGLIGREENGRNEEPSANPTDAPDADMSSVPNRNGQEFERLRRNMRRLAYASIFGRDSDLGAEQDDDDSSDDDIDRDDADVADRVSNEFAENIVDLFAPLDTFDTFASSDSSLSLPAEGGGDADANGAQAAMMEDDNDGSSSDSFSGSSFSSMSSGSTVSFPGSNESEIGFDDNHEPEVENMNDLECMRMENLKSDWDIMREMRQRQHGLPHRSTPATIGSVQYNPSQFQKRAYGSVHMVQRLGLLHRLEKHASCVNSLCFNTSGKLLASGSDDLHINLWHWESRKLLKSIVSGHRSNVFQTKFMEYKGYEEELEIISTGRDGQVRHTRVDPSGRANIELLFRGHKPIHKIAIPACNEFSFLTAGEDGKVRMYDLRQGKLETVKKLRRPLFSIATHPYDSEFCVAGSDALVRVYDMRHSAKPIKLLVSQRHSEPKASESVTCAVYNESGTEILASYCDDDIYLYDNIAKDPVVKPMSRYQGHCNMQTIKGVNFFGPRSEYVVSGSDCGYIYIWDKRTRAIVNWMNGVRNGAVNCLEPHPEFPILATSGVDNDIKIWVPKGLNENQTTPIFAKQDLKRYVRRNISMRRQTHIPRSVMRLATPSISRYFTPNSFRRRFAQIRADGRELSANAQHSDSDSDMDLNDDDDFASHRHHMMSCNPS